MPVLPRLNFSCRNAPETCPKNKIGANTNFESQVAVGEAGVAVDIVVIVVVVVVFVVVVIVAVIIVVAVVAFVVVVVLLSLLLLLLLLTLNRTICHFLSDTTSLIWRSASTWDWGKNLNMCG